MCRCRHRCFDRVPVGDRREILDRFRSLASKNEQDAYLQGLIAVCGIKQRRSRQGEKHKPKSCSFKYSVNSSSGKVEVCKTAFSNLHAVTTGRVRRVSSLLREGKSPKDKRGQNISGNAIPGSTVITVKDHISSFPTKISRYSGKEKHYLNETLTVKTMHSLFTDKYPTLNVKYKFYLKIFREHFDLSFGRPQIDTCCKCEELGIKIKSPSLNDSAKRVAVAELLVHKRRAKKFYAKMEAVKSKCLDDDSVVAISMDFMQNLQLPVIPVQEVFYMRQLTYNVFNIHNIGQNKATYYTYHEGIAKKGANEVASFFLDYINNEIPTNAKHLHIFTDACPGQNRNQTIVHVCIALVNIGRFTTVTHYFPIRGHSFLPNDRNFAMAKKVVRKHDRVFLPHEYTEMLITASQHFKFTVKMVDTGDILDCKDWGQGLFKKNCLSIESSSRKIPRHEKQAFTISTFSELKYYSEKIGMVQASVYIDGLVPHTFKLATQRDIPLPTKKAYPEGRVPINKNKQEDLRKLLQYIPDDKKHFYEELLAWPTQENVHVDAV